MNPNEVNSEEAEQDEQTCPSCGMEKSTWTVNQGQGVKKEGESYCCQGCADGTGCTCEEETPEETKQEAGSVRKRN